MILGICGKIAAGKSEVRKIFEKKGFLGIDADEIVHKLYEPGKVGAKKIEENFGKDFLDAQGAVDREKLRIIVFKNEDYRQVLNNLIRPLVYAEIREIITYFAEKDIVIEAISFGDKNLRSLLDEIIWVDRDDEEIRNTLFARGFDFEMIENVLELYKKPKKIRKVLANKGNLADLQKNVEKL